jgi:hypothetical protein
LRIELRWDQAAFSRLTHAMEQCCRALAGLDAVDRWLAEGFWYLSWFPRSWTDHPAWAEDPARDQIDQGTHLLDLLAYWFFTGEPATIDDSDRPQST